MVAPLLAGLIAAGSLVNSSGFISNNALGYSEGLATALALIAVDSYLDGAPRRAFVIGFFAALDRPELWFIWGPYGLYLFWRDPGARKLVVALFALIPVLWFLPELWGSGHLLRGVTRAQHPRSNSAAFAKCPVCTVFRKEAWPAVWDRVKIPGMIALLVAAIGLWRTRDAWWKRRVLDRGVRARAWLLGLGVFGFAWWLGVAIETQAGFSGNNRYLVLGTAPVAIVGGVAWGWFSHALAEGLRRLSARGERSGATRSQLHDPSRGGGRRRLFLAVPSWIGKGIVSLPRTHHALVYQAHLRADLTAAVREAGGSGALLGVRAGDDRGLPGADESHGRWASTRCASKRRRPTWSGRRGRRSSFRLARSRTRDCCRPQRRSSPGSTRGRATAWWRTCVPSGCSRPAPVR